MMQSLHYNEWNQIAKTMVCMQLENCYFHIIHELSVLMNWLQALYRPHPSASLSTSPLQWRHNERDGVSNHQPHDCLLKRLFGSRSKKTSNLRVTVFCAGNSPLTGEFPTQMASNGENVSIWWRHHDPSYHNHFGYILIILNFPSTGWGHYIQFCTTRMKKLSCELFYHCPYAPSEYRESWWKFKKLYFASVLRLKRRCCHQGFAMCEIVRWTMYHKITTIQLTVGSLYCTVISMVWYNTAVSAVR